MNGRWNAVRPESDVLMLKISSNVKVIENVISGMGTFTSMQNNMDTYSIQYAKCS